MGYEAQQYYNEEIISAPIYSSDIKPFMKPTPPTKLNFSDKDGVKIGELDWSSGKFVFFGNAEESAKIFFDYLERITK